MNQLVLFVCDFCPAKTGRAQRHVWSSDVVDRSGATLEPVLTSEVWTIAFDTFDGAGRHRVACPKCVEREKAAP